MEVEFELTQQDVAAFHRYHAAHPVALVAPRTGRYGSWVGILIVVFFVSLLLNSFEGFRDGFLYGLVGAFLAIGALFLYLRKKSNPEALAKRALEEDPLRYKRTRLALIPEGLAWETSTERGILYWKGIRKIEITPGYAFFYKSLVLAIIIPGRAFPDEESFKKFVETAQDYHDQALAAEGRFSDRSTSGGGEFIEKGEAGDPGITR
jgi:hypothetical protein